MKKRKRSNNRNEQGVKYIKGRGPNGGYMMTLVLMDHDAKISRHVTLESIPEADPKQEWGRMTADLGQVYFNWSLARWSATFLNRMWNRMALADLARARQATEQIKRDATGATTIVVGTDLRSTEPPQRVVVKPGRIFEDQQPSAAEYKLWPWYRRAWYRIRGTVK